MQIEKGMLAALAVLVMVGGVGTAGCRDDDGEKPTLTLSKSSWRPDNVDPTSCRYFRGSEVTVHASSPNGGALSYDWKLLPSPDERVDGSLAIVAGGAVGRWQECSGHGNLNSDTVRVTVTDTRGASATAAIEVP